MIPLGVAWLDRGRACSKGQEDKAPQRDFPPYKTERDKKKEKKKKEEEKGHFFVFLM
jgi:hypothetical protein